MIKTTIDAGRAAGIPVGMCGEMAGDPLAIPLLIAMGLEVLSASPCDCARGKTGDTFAFAERL